jgi:hypothetical protein
MCQYPKMLTLTQYRCEITNRCVEAVVWFIDAFQISPQHVSASHCHHQWVVFTSEATQPISVLWMYVDHSLSSVANYSHRLCVFFLYMFLIVIWPTLLYVYYTVTLHVCFIGLYLICYPQESTTRWSVTQTVDGEIKVQAPGFHIYCFTWCSHPSTVGHTGQTVIHIHPQQRYWLSSLWGKYDPPDVANNLLKHVGVKIGMHQQIILIPRRLCWLFHGDTTKCSVQISKLTQFLNFACRYKKQWLQCFSWIF